jgi:uncharacterized protein (TIGR03435 family)
MSFTIRNLYLAAVFLAAHVFAQTATPQPAPPPLPDFEVASVRMVDTPSMDQLMRRIGMTSVSPLPANRITFHNASLGIIISYAYKVDTYLVEGKPDWLSQQEYDVNAKVEGDLVLTRDEMRPLLQHLLQQRFHLAAHWETRSVPGFELVIAKGGPKLQSPKESPHPYAQILTNGIQTWSTSLDFLAGILHTPAGRTVVNKTGLDGKYDIKLDYAPPNDPDSPLPDLSTALQEQLGLKLVSAKVPVQILVIDHVEKIPTDN